MTSGPHLDPSDAVAARLLDVLGPYLPTRRWFAGKGLPFEVVHVAPLSWLDPDEWPRTRVEMVTINRLGADGATEAVDVYQVPVAYLPEPDDELKHALIATVRDPELGDVVAYDATAVRAATRTLLEHFGGDRPDSDLRAHLVDETDLPDPSTPGTVMTGEQSNTSIVYGDDAILKLFRRVDDGANPDIEVLNALTRAGSEHVAPLLGWLEGTWRDASGTERTADLGMLQVFLRTASDGWDLALASLRDLLVEADLHPEEVGGDLAGESERLGEAVASVHRSLAEAFGSVPAGAGQVDELVESMLERLERTARLVPELRPHIEGLSRRFESLRGSSLAFDVQRVHGDLHLGQTLRTAIGWKIIDFEGEPAKPLAERRAPAPPMRDVAGMLRSFDYAGGVALREFGASPQLLYRTDEWTQRNREAFVAGYAATAGVDIAAQQPLIAAFEADKAVYEAAYEARHRPDWLAIPLHAIERIAAEE